MAKEDFIQSEGVVSESLPNATFRVEVAGQSELIFCHLSGKMRKHFIKVLPGDRVLFEMSPYDLSKGRITRRLKPGEKGLKESEEAAAAEALAAEIASEETIEEAPAESPAQEKPDAS